MIKNKRRCGNTTRQIDNYIQQLFEHGKVVLQDHAADSEQANMKMRQTFIARLSLEHRATFLQSYDGSAVPFELVVINRKPMVFELLSMNWIKRRN